LTKVVTPSKNNEKNPPLLSILIKRFEGSCGTFGDGEKKPL
jgi:hypothetical protein